MELETRDRSSQTGRMINGGLKRPVTVFLAALLNSQPMGFYAPAQLGRDAREHGVEIRPICVNASRWDSTLEGPERDDGRFAVRLGMNLVKGLTNEDAARLVAARGDRPFASVDDLWRRAAVKGAALTHLAEADAFRPGLGLARREHYSCVLM
ncbi:hypothetical protein KOXY103107_16060 [Komagataeibacter xylinus]